MLTKEELIGRKFRSMDKDDYLFIEQDGEIGIKSVESREEYFNDYNLEYCNNAINSNIWKLLPEENKMYKTPKGIEYGVGSTFKQEGMKHEPWTITEIKNNKVAVKWGNKGHLSLEEGYSLEEFNENIDTIWTLVIDYKQVDPKTITFDFTNTKIRVNNPEESEWIQEVAFNNRWKWVNDDIKVMYTKDPYLIFHTKDKCFSRIPKSWGVSYFDNHKNKKEITIQNILNKYYQDKQSYLVKEGVEFHNQINNQMKEVIEVGDIYSYRDINYTIKRVESDKFWCVGGGYFTNNTRELKLVSKANKQEIVGYELLKDLPGIPAGTKSSSKSPYTFGSKYTFFTSEINDTTWFKPIYKAKEVVVKISGDREVKVSNNKISIQDDVEFMSFHQFESLTLNLLGTKIVTGRQIYNLKIRSFELGCQVFDMNDIPKIEAALKEVQ